MQQQGRNAHSEKNEDFPELIKDITLFKEFESHTAAKLAEFGIEAWFDPGSIIFHESDQSGQFYLLTQGSIALEQPGPDRTVRIQTIQEGEFLGWSALLGSGTRHFQARALTRVGAITFDGSLLRRVCEEDPRFGYDLMKRLVILLSERLDATRMLVAEGQGSLSY